MPVKVNIYNQKGETVGEKEVSSKVFGVKLKESLVHQAVITQLANERQVLAHTKTRAEVRGGGKKPWKQKGTGRARVGSSRSPIWIGGGVTFGPRKERNFKLSINKKMKQKALFMVLSDKLASNLMIVVDKFELAEFKTKLVDSIIKNFEKKVFAAAEKEKKADKKTKRSLLLISESEEQMLRFSARNLAGVDIINLQNINILDLLKNKNLVISQSVLEKIDKQYAK